MKNLTLFIDESGIANPKVKESPAYVLSGCVVNKEWQETLKTKSDHIKFKYWGKTNIVFHSKEIARAEGVFKILKEEKVKSNFIEDLFIFLRSTPYYMFFVVVDKEKALKLNWDDNKVYRETARIMVKNFILSLLAQENTKGRLVAESATSIKDFSFHKEANYFLSNGLPDLKVSYKQVQDVLTEVSFVTKKNYDIEEQIADLLAYGAKLKFLKKDHKDLYDKEIIRIMNSKLFKMNPAVGEKKKKYQSKIESFKIIP